MKKTQSGYQYSQRGGALLVSLVMIFMLSIMGISAIRGSNLEQRMAVNSIHASKCSQIAESSTELALNDESNLTAAYNLQPAVAGNPKPNYSISTDLQDAAAVVSRAKLKYLGHGAALGASLGIGSQNFVALRYEANGNATIDAAKANCNVKQGAYQIAPET